MTQDHDRPEDDERLLSLAMAIADGEAVDWSGAALTSGEGGMPLTPALQRVEQIVRGHQALHDPAGSPADDTLLTEMRRDSVLNDADVKVQWGPLEVFEKIGRGAFGDVYRAHDPRLQRDVALKIVTTDGDHAEQTFEEGRLLARVRHPNVVAVYGAERVGQRVGIWMEYVQGRTLAQEVTDHGPLSAMAAARIGIDVCRALTAVHNAGLLHRDVKAQNVMRDRDGRIVLGDFGTGVPVLAGASTAVPQIAGTPLYLAPEVLSGRPATSASDVYSVGVLLYFLVTGGYPTSGRTLAEIKAAHDANTRTTLRKARPELPRGFVEIVDALIEPGPDRRFGSAAAAEAALRTWLETTMQAPARRRRRAWLAAALSTAVVITAGTIAWTDLPRLVRSRVLGGLLAGEPISRQIADVPCIGAPSEDGQWIACVERPAHLQARGGKLPAPVVVFNPHTGELKVARTPNAGERLPSARISPDGTSVAYVVLRTTPFVDDNGQRRNRALPIQLRGMDVDGSNERTIQEFPADVTGAVINDWSAGDNQIIVRLWRGREPQLAAQVHASGGPLQQVYEFTDGPPQTFSVSRGGRYLAYDALQQSGSPERDIRICDLQSGRCETPFAHPAFDFAPRWTPDGRLFFMSDRAGTMGLWSTELSDLRVAGGPELVQDTGRGQMQVTGFGPDGLTFYNLRSGSFDIYSAALPAGTDAVAPLRLSPRAVDTNRTPVWSSDGRRLAYMSMRGPYSGDGAMRLVIQDLGDRQEREFKLDVPPNMTRLAWSPDDTRLAMRTSLAGRFGVHLLDVGSGQLVQSLRGPAVPDLDVEDQIIDIGWADRNTIVYAGARGLHAFDVTTGAHRTIFNAPPDLWIVGMSLGPDQRSAAFVGNNGRESAFSFSALFTLDLNEGALREVYRVPHPEYLSLQTWAAGGIYVTRSDSSLPFGRRPSQLWRISSTDGAATQVATPIERLEELRVHPDGSRIAFTSSSQRDEFWMTTFR